MVLRYLRGQSKTDEIISPEDEIPCTKTLYRLLWKGELPLTLFELPKVLTRRKRGIPRISKRKNGKGIELRPQEVLDRNTFGHWESDTVLGRKHKGEPAVFTIVERLLWSNYIMCISTLSANRISLSWLFPQTNSR